MMEGEKYKGYFDKDYYQTSNYKSGYDTKNFNSESYLNEAVPHWIVQSMTVGDIDLTNRKILEIGCAFGWMVETFHNMGLDVYGQDISRFSIENSSHIIGSRVRECTDFEIAFDDKFDFIYSIETFEHLPKNNVSEYFKNIYESLTENGIIFCTICLGHNDDRGADLDQSHQTLQPREWWCEKFEDVGFVRRKDLEADAYELGIQTSRMDVGEWLPRSYNWHVFVYEKKEIKIESISNNQILINKSGTKPNLLIIGNRPGTFDYPSDDFFQIDNWGNYLSSSFNSKYIHYNDVDKNSLDKTDLIICTLSTEVMEFISTFNSPFSHYSGKTLGIVDTTIVGLEQPDLRVQAIKALDKVDLVGNIWHEQGVTLLSLFCDRSKIVHAGHMFPINRFYEVYNYRKEELSANRIPYGGEFVVITGGYFDSRIGFSSISSYLASTVADKVISPIDPLLFADLRDNHIPYFNSIPSVIELMVPAKQDSFWRDVLPGCSVLLHLGNEPATGRLTADCAAAGIPSIGIDTQYQRVCFPELMVSNLYSLEESKSLLCKLRDDKEFYEYMSFSGKQRLISNNDAELKNMESVLGKLGFDVYLDNWSMD